MDSLKNIVDKYGECSGLNRGTGYKNWGGDLNKHNYTKFYESILSDRRESKMNFLEIGVFKGHGLASFSDYLPNSNIYGLDLSNKEFLLNKDNLENMGAFSNNNLIGVYSGDSTSPSTWDAEVYEFPSFNIIIDDGLHRLEAQFTTFKNFWPKLKKGGIYVVEDILKKNESQLEKYIKESEFSESIVDFKIEHPNKNGTLFFLFK